MVSAGVGRRASGDAPAVFGMSCPAANCYGGIPRRGTAVSDAIAVSSAINYMDDD